MDDFTFKKRHAYGTIIVDESTHIPMTILEGRDSSVLKELFKSSKQITAVAQERVPTYAKAVEEILPE